MHLPRVIVSIGINNSYETRVAVLHSGIAGYNLSLNPSTHSVVCKVPHFSLSAGTYTLDIKVLSGHEVIIWAPRVEQLIVEVGDFYATGRLPDSNWGAFATSSKNGRCTMVRNSKVDTIRILYYGAGWPTNIGNAFIDLGAMAILHAAVPNAHVTFASEMPRWFFGPGAKRSQIQKSRRFHFWRGDQPVEEPIMDNALDIASVTQCDLVVFSGMAMCEVFVRVNGPTILSLSGRGVPVLLLGTGAQQYSQQEKDFYGDFLRRVRPIGFVSRDDRAYDMFADYVHQAQKEIDCGFFCRRLIHHFPLYCRPI